MGGAIDGSVQGACRPSLRLEISVTTVIIRQRIEVAVWLPQKFGL
jgi:hypothetical protein